MNISEHTNNFIQEMKRLGLNQIPLTELDVKRITRELQTIKNRI